jgi:hypothetical protein
MFASSAGQKSILWLRYPVYSGQVGRFFASISRTVSVGLSSQVGRSVGGTIAIDLHGETSSFFVALPQLSLSLAKDTAFYQETL